jgi:hypothetical protein
MRNNNQTVPVRPKRTLRAAHLIERYRVDPRTITRWKEADVLPPPDLRINGHDYWFEETIERNECEKLSGRNKEKPPVVATFEYQNADAHARDRLVQVLEANLAQTYDPQLVELLRQALEKLKTRNTEGE